MKNSVLFSEVQKQTQKWIWFVLIILLLTTLVGAIQQVIFNKGFGPNPIPDWGFLVIGGVLLALLYVLVKTKLYTEISPDGILFLYKPFFRKPRLISWDHIRNCYVRLYAPMKEYGGWGLRTAFTGNNGKAYNVTGNIGIQLELTSGEKILIGTQKAKEAEAALETLKKEK